MVIWSSYVNILVVEDDIKLNQIVAAALGDCGYNAVGCLDAQKAYDELRARNFDMIITDVMMPRVDGFEFASSVRALDKNIPILFMTARDDMTSKRRGYNIGIDDYMVKPIVLDELTLRVGALLRRANIEKEKRLIVGDTVMNEEERTVTVGGEEIAVTAREFNLLFKMLSYPKRTFSRSQLMDEFWGLDSETTLRAVDVYIVKLRDKFAVCQDFKIMTVHGLGYKAVLNEEK